MASVRNRPRRPRRILADHLVYEILEADDTKSQVNSCQGQHAMYAIIADGGRQYRVEEGQELDIDFREAATKGDEVEFDRVLAVSVAEQPLQVGSPAVDGAKVTAEVVGVEQGPKLIVQKLRRRKNSRRRTGHRQLYTRVRINKIVGP